MNKGSAQALAKWAKAESRALMDHPHFAGIGLPLEQWVIETWKAERPDLVAAMEQWGALPQLAHVLTERMLDAEKINLRSGMNPSDARMEAVKDWLMFDPNAGAPQEVGAATTA